MGRRPVHATARAVLGAALGALLALGGCTVRGLRAPTLPAARPAPAGTIAAPTPAAPLPAASGVAAAPPALPSGGAPGFSDVPPGDWAAGAIDGLAAAGLILGVAPGSFDPDAAVSRAEFAVLLGRTAGAPAAAVGPAFSDLAAGAWYAPGVEQVVGLGWMAGTAPGVFGPDGQVTRGEAALASIRALGLGRVADDEAGASCPFSDCGAIPGWALGAGIVAEHLGLLVGAPGGAFEAGAPLTRAEAAALLWRLRGTAPAAVQAEGGRVAASVSAAVSVGPAGDTAHPDGPSDPDGFGPAVTGALAVGASAQITAGAQDAPGYDIPAAFSWSVSGPGRLVPAAGGQTATLQATAPGAITVSVTIAGGGPSAQLTLQAMQPALLRVQGLPPAGLAHAHYAVTVSVRGARGAADPAADGGSALLLAAPAGSRGTLLSTSAPLAEGTATLPFPDLGPGTYVLTVAWPGAPDVQFTYQALARPLGALTLNLPPAAPSGGQVAVAATLPVGGSWPLQVTTSGLPLGPPPLPGDAAPAAVLAVDHAAATLSGSGTVATLSATAPGAGRVEVAVPGGAISAASGAVQVEPSGAFAALPDPAPVAAGQSVTVSVGLQGHLADVVVEPLDPAGHPLPAVAASAAGGAASVSLTLQTAGRWHLLWMAPGAVPAQDGSVQVLPGPPAVLVVDPTPTGVLLPGQSAVLRAWLADAAGNPLAVPFELTAAVVSGPGALRPPGAAAAAPGPGLPALLPAAPDPLRLAGPGAAAVFAAAGAGSTVLRFSSPDHPALAPIQVQLRTVATPAGRIAGKGLWLTFPDWKAQTDQQIVAEALADGATHIYLEVATSSDGFYGGRALDSLLPLAHAAGLAVLDWVYPELSNPAADAGILRQVGTYRTPGGDAADGLALDIEANLDAPTVAAYAGQAKAVAGPRGLVVAVTWAPEQLPHYPYAALAPYVGAFAPMDYWHVQESDYSYAQVYAWVLGSVQQLRRLAGRPSVPVEVIAETFDWHSPVTGQGEFSPTAAELQAAVQAASDAGAGGVSFYRASTATPPEQTVIAAAWPPAG